MSAAITTTPQFDLHYDDWGRLVLVDADGKYHEGVTPVRSFPLSDPEHWISICDSSTRELICIANPQSLPAKTRETLNLALAKNEFIPIIERIVHATHGEPAEWQVETNRGPRTFVLKGEDDIRTLSDGRLIVTDSDGVRYFINNVRQLDGHSRRTLERFL